MRFCPKSVAMILALAPGFAATYGCRTAASSSDVTVAPPGTSTLGRQGAAPKTMVQCEWTPGPGPLKTRKIVHYRPGGVLVQQVSRFLEHSVTQSQVSLSPEPPRAPKPLPDEMAAPSSAACTSVQSFVSPTTLVKEQRLLLPVGPLRSSLPEEVGALPTKSYVPFRIFSVTVKKVNLLESLRLFCQGRNAQIRARQEQDVTVITGVFEDLPFLAADKLETINVSDETLRSMVEMNPAYLAEVGPADILGPTPTTFVGWPIEWETTKFRYYDRSKRLRIEFQFALLNRPFGQLCDRPEDDIPVY